MALFKVSKGLEANLPQAKTAGYCWYTTDSSLFYIDFEDNNGVVQRRTLNAKDAETLTGASLATILNSSNVEIPTSKAVLDVLNSMHDELSSSIDNVLDEAKSHTDENISALEEEFENTVRQMYGDDFGEALTPIRSIAIEESDSALASAQSYTDTKTADMASNTFVETKIVTHNTSTDAHNDIRVLLSDIKTKLNNFLDVDDATTDQLSEVITLINNNKGTLDSLTSTKVNVSDIINNLTTNASNKVLSAAQGVELKGLIDALQAVANDKADGVHGHAISEITNLQNTLDAKASQSAVDSLTNTVGAKAAASDLTAHTGNTNNPHGVTLSQLGVTATATEVSHMSGTTSNVQGQLDSKASASALTNHTGRTDNPHGVTLGQLGLTATATELNYVDGVTSNVQTQLDAKVPTARTVNGKALSSNISLTASDVGAATKKTLTLSLPVASWSNNTLTITATGATASNTIFVAPTPASQEAYTAAGVMCTAQSANSLTFTCTSVPSAALSVNIVILD